MAGMLRTMGVSCMNMFFHGCMHAHTYKSKVFALWLLFVNSKGIRASVDHLCRDGTSEISRYPNEMKGDVGMSLHEKERNKKMPTPRHKVTHNPIPTSLFCFNMLFVCLFVMNALGKANSKTS